MPHLETELVEYQPGTTTAVDHLTMIDPRTESQSARRLFWIHLCGFALPILVGNALMTVFFFAFAWNGLGSGFQKLSLRCSSEDCEASQALIGPLLFLLAAAVLELVSFICGLYAGVSMFIKVNQLITANLGSEGIQKFRLLNVLQLGSILGFILLETLGFAETDPTFDLYLEILLFASFVTHVVTFNIVYRLVLNFYYQETQFEPASSVVLELEAEDNTVGYHIADPEANQQKGEF